MPSSAQFLNRIPDFLGRTPSRWMIVIVAIFALIAGLAIAWVTDDAMITIRHVINLLEGYGPVFNVGERVQGYTHPLWFGLITFFSWLTGLPVVTPSLLGAAMLVPVIWLLGRESQTTGHFLCTAVLLLMANSIMDFISSGLEPPLALLLTACLWRVSQREDQQSFAPRTMALAGGLVAGLVLTRPDYLLIGLPVLIAMGVPASWRARFTGAVALALPLGAWGLFALIYYGDPLPNTFHAKTFHAIDGSEIIKQGFSYIWHSAQFDIATAFLVIVGVLLLGFAALSQRVARAWLAAMLLYLAYIISVGGDFMAGRFLCVPTLIGALALVRYPQFDTPVTSRVALYGVPLLLMMSLQTSSVPGHVIPEDVRWKLIENNGIADERAYYSRSIRGTNSFSLLFTVLSSNFELVDANVIMQLEQNAHHWRSEVGDKSERVAVQCGGLGQFGLLQPDVHFVDDCGLTDPLMALIAYKPQGTWRIGHFRRKVPDGYLDSVRTGVNQIADPATAALYNCVHDAHQGDLFERDRWVSIGKLHAWRYGLMKTLEQDACAGPKRSLTE